MTKNKNTIFKPKELIFDDYFNEYLNKSVIKKIKIHNTIVFGYKFNQNINNLPDNINSLQFNAVDQFIVKKN